MPRTSAILRPLGVAASAGAAVVLLVALAGCTPSAQVPDRIPTVKIESPRVPAALEQQGVHVVSSEAIGSSGSQPALLAAAIQKPGKAPALTLWSTVDGVTWTQSSFSPKTTAAITDVVGAASNSYTVVGGNTWADGAIRPVLYGSADRATWSSIPLPPDIGEGFRVSAMAVVGKNVVLIATDADGHSLGAVRSGTTWRSAKLPTAAKGTLLNPASLAGDAKQLVLIARPGREGAASPTVAYSSKNGGLSWLSTASPVTDKAASVGHAVYTGSAWVITGSQPTGDAAVARPMAWSSSDGAAWTADALPEPSSNASAWRDIADVTLDSGTVGADGTVSAVMSNANAAVSTVWTRDASGSWVERGETGVNAASGDDGVAFTLSNGHVATLLGGDTWLRAGVFADGWTEGTVFAARDASFAALSATKVGNRLVIPLSRTVFTVAPDLSWTNSSESQVATVSAGGAVASMGGVPAEAAALHDVVYGSSGTAAVALGWTWPGSGPLLARGESTSDGTTWKPVSGFPSDGATNPTAIVKAGDTWIAATQHRSSTNVGTVSHPALFSSPDGNTWTAVTGDFGSGPLTTQVTDVCAAPGGAAVAVGWVQQGASEYRPAVWAAKDGTWSRVDLGKLADDDGYLEHCADGGSGVIATGELGGRSVVLAGSATGTWSTRFTAPRGDDIGTPVKVSGGFVANGSHGAGRQSQAVLWLSKTGSTWTPVAVPSLQSGETSTVAAQGKDVVVTMSPEIGHPVIIVRNIGSVIAQRAK